MTGGRPRRWDDVKAIFHEAAALRVTARDEYLARACGEDADLRAEVESLLASHDDDGPFLDRAPFAGAARAFAAGLDEPTEGAAGFPPGTRIGPYEVLERLGSGGMADVYRAHDTTLDRFVALKIVSDPFASGRTGDRMLREARAASALNHPHVCTIYEVGEFEGRPYLAMEYIAGQSLSRLIPSEGLPADAVIKYGVQIADALAHAHEHGVIHRDLKGANIAVTRDGRAKVLDFGLARRLQAIDVGPQAGTLTRAETISGTPAYMAPELLQGHAADARSDIWAFGVLLYEMASGRRPFRGATPFEITSAILKDAPPPLPSRVPAGLRSIVLRCLERDPKERFQRASDVKRALETLDGATRPSRPAVDAFRWKILGIVSVVTLLLLAAVAYYRGLANRQPAPTSVSVAALPFTIQSGAEDIGFLGLGLPDTVTSRLALVSGLRVRPTSAVVRWEQDTIEPLAAGRQLDVEYVLTGVVQKQGDRIQVTPRLMRVSDGESLWSRQYALTSSDLLGVQDRIAAGIVQALEIQMTSADRARVYRRYTQNQAAYDAYLRGRSELVRNRRDRAPVALKSFEAALARDPDYALAHAGVASASAQLRLFFASAPDVQMWEARAHKAAQRALQLDPMLAEAHEALAAVYRYAEFDWHQAIEESNRALALNPNLDQPHLYRASAFMHLGLLDRVPAEATAAMEINPVNDVEPYRVQGAAAMYDGRFDEAVPLLERARAGDRVSAEWNLAYAYYYVGRQADAETMLKSLRGSARAEYRAQATLASVLAARGHTSEAKKLIGAVTSGSYTDHHVEYALGAAYAQLHDVPEAIRWLREARSNGFPCYPWFEHDPLLAPLRSTSEFQRLIAELKRSSETTNVRHKAQN